MFVALLFFSNNIDKIWVKQIATIYLIMVVIMPIWWVVARKILKFYRSKGYNFRKVIIVGYGRTGKLLEKELQSDAGYGYKIMGVFDDSPTVAKNTPHYKGTTSDVEAFA
jgi:putative colanic acid biosynthesis UDP-glucose lipid carrier transferase